MSSGLYKRPIMSLRSGSRIGIALEPAINPHNLKIVGWWCKADGHNGNLILLTEDVREVMPTGLAVNDDAALSAPNDLVRQSDVLGIGFQLIGKVTKTKRHKLGKVSDYSYDEESFFIQKLYVTRSLIKVFTNDDTLIIDRQQVIEVTDHYILVDDAEIKATESEETVAPAVAAP